MCRTERQEWVRFLFSKLWRVLKSTAAGYIEDSCLSRGAAIAYYTVFSLVPVLIIVIAVAGSVFGEDAARGALLKQISGLMGRQAGEAVQAMVASAAAENRSGWAGVIGAEPAVQLGGFAPTLSTADAGKVRLGGFAPSLPERR